MKRLGLLVKEISSEQIKKSLDESKGVFIINYSGLSGPDLNALRQSLRNIKARLFVIKNTVTRRTLKDSKVDPLLKLIEGPCGLVFAKDDPVAVSRILSEFWRNHEALKLQGGFLEDRILERKDIEQVARLPTKEVLRAQLTGLIKSPLSGLVYVLKGNLRKLVYCLEQIKQKKSTLSSSPQSTLSSRPQ